MNLSAISIKWKLVFVIVLVATIVSGSQILLFCILDSNTYWENKRAKTQVISEMLAANLTPALRFNDRNDAIEVLSSLNAEPSLISAYIFNSSNGLLGEYIRAGENLSVPIMLEYNRAEEVKDNRYVVTKAIIVEGKLLGTLILTSDLKSLEQRQKARIILGLDLAFGFMILSIGLALVLQRTFTYPIRQLVATMMKIISLKDYSLRAEDSSTKEFAQLVKGFNLMLDEIESRDSRLAQQMDSLQKANKALDEFVYVASHDLKAPLRAVESLSVLIGKAVSGSLPPEKQEYLDLMRNRINRMEKLLNDLLEYSRVGRLQAKIEKVRISEMLKDIVQLLAPPTSFKVIVPENLPTIVTARTPLEQALRNLISNAIKHHDRQDGRIEVSVLERDQELEFCIADDGAGIPSEFHQKIFQMFQTLRPRDEVEGSGMGLALVKKIVEEQGGRIWLESEIGQGTKFYFTWKTT